MESALSDKKIYFWQGNIKLINLPDSLGRADLFFQSNFIAVFLESTPQSSSIVIEDDEISWFLGWYIIY